MKLTFMQLDCLYEDSAKKASDVAEDEDEAPALESVMSDGALEEGSPFRNPFDGGVMEEPRTRSVFPTMGATSPFEFSPDEDDDESCGIEILDSPTIDLKPRHNKILDTLESQTTITVKELAMMLERGEKPVASDLRFLMTHDLVDRVRIRGMYKYFIIRGQKIVLHDGADEEDSEMCT